MTSDNANYFSKIPFVGGQVVITDFVDGNFSVRCSSIPPAEYVLLMQRLGSCFRGYYAPHHYSWNFKGYARKDVLNAISEWSANHG